MTYTITHREKAIITAAAKYFCSNRKIYCRVRTHYDVARASVICSPNALLYPPESELDLCVMDELKGKVEFDLTPAGDAEVQVYVYLADWCSLADTIRAVWKDGVLVSVGGIVASSLAMRIDQKAANAKARKVRTNRYTPDQIARLEAAIANDPAELRRPTGFATTGRKHNCGVVALAALTGAPYALAEDAVWKATSRDNNLTNREKWDGRCYLVQDWPVAAAMLGVTLKLHSARRQKVSTLMRDLDPSKTYAIMTRGHVVTVRAGLIMDQVSSGTPAQRAGEANKMVKAYWSVDIAN